MLKQTIQNFPDMERKVIEQALITLASYGLFELEIDSQKRLILDSWGDSEHLVEKITALQQDSRVLLELHSLGIQFKNERTDR